jgi:hypothetical protein
MLSRSLLESCSHSGNAYHFVPDRPMPWPVPPLVFRWYRGGAELARSRPIERTCVVLAWLVAPFASAAAARSDPSKWRQDINNFDWLARRFGVWLGSAPGGREPLPPERTETLVRWAFRAQPLADYACLPGTMVQVVLHGVMGDDVIVVVGVRRGGENDRVSAHAWVEAHGLPRAEVRAEFLPLATFRPRDHEGRSR